MIKLNKKNMVRALSILTIISSTSIISHADIKNDIWVESADVFNEGEWYPGKIQENNIYITNNRDKNIIINKIYINLKSCINLINNEYLDENSKEFEVFSENIKIKLLVDEKVLLEEKLKNIVSKKGINLTEGLKLKAYEQKQVTILIGMDNEMGNEYQGIETVFDIDFKYKDSSDNDNLGSEDGNQNTDDQDNNQGNSNQENSNDENSNDENSNDENSELDTDIDSNDKLPQTGGIINSFSLVVLGSMAIGTGIILNKKEH